MVLFRRAGPAGQVGAGQEVAGAPGPFQVNLDCQGCQANRAQVAASLRAAAFPRDPRQSGADAAGSSTSS